MAQGIDKII